MRKIKFRFYSNFHKKMYDDLSLIGLHYRYGDDPCIYSGELILDEDIGERVQKYSDGQLMQFTGLKDKNGVEIYEGDLVGTGWQGETVGVVEFERGMFLVNTADSTMYFNHPDMYEVIGNIYEHPHLFKEESN